MMDRTKHRLMMALVIGLFALSITSLAFAQGSTPEVSPTTPAEDPSPTPTQSASTAPSTQRPVMSANELTWFIGIELLFTAILIGVVLLYIYNSQREYYQVFRSLTLPGQAVTTVMASGFVSQQLGNLQDGAPTVDQLVAAGPGTVIVGTPTAGFAAKLGSAAADQATWTVEPADAATVSPTQGAAVSVTATRAGAFTITVTPQSGSTATPVQLPVTAVAPSTTPGLPFIGEGYLSLILALVLIVAVLTLALRGVVDGAVVATLFGTLAGYIFGVRTSTGSTSGPTNTSQQ